jgi:hypothetical protein
MSHTSDTAGHGRAPSASSKRDATSPASYLRHDDEKAPYPELPNPTVAVAEQHDLTLGAILRGTAANPLTNFEKKAALINACVVRSPARIVMLMGVCSELDKFGFGRYQICIWFLTGFGYFLDLAWAQGVGLIASAV